MIIKLDRIETQLRTLIEHKLVRLFSGSQPHHDLVNELIRVMRESLQKNDRGEVYAPDQFILHVLPDDLIEWQVNQDILDEIAALINKQGQTEGLLFQNKPSIALSVRPDISNRRFQITAHFTPKQASLPDTAAMTQEERNQSPTALPENAFFVIGGTNTVPLEKPIINIGRHSTNDIVLNDLHISRHHVQLRAIKKCFVIFDVGSTGGTFLNEKRISQATLQAGDVIRIGKTNLIYIQDTTSANPTTVTPIELKDNSLGDNN